MTLIAVLLMLAGIFIGVTGGMVELRWLKFTGVYITLFGFVAMVAGNLILQRIAETRTRWRVADMKSQRRRRAESPRTAATVERADTTNKLLPVGENDFIPTSVVEDTTELLREPARRESTAGDRHEL
jgi:hypothetical protein